jgi:hypothetical protein
MSQLSPGDHGNALDRPVAPCVEFRERVRGKRQSFAVTVAI